MHVTREDDDRLYGDVDTLQRVFLKVLRGCCASAVLSRGVLADARPSSSGAPPSASLMSPLALASVFKPAHATSPTCHTLAQVRPLHFMGYEPADIDQSPLDLV